MYLEGLSQDKQQQLLDYLDLVIEKNKELNLTRIDTKDKGILLHLEDSLACLDEFTRHSDEFVDIGTGGGFPGVPLAIASDRHGVLVDSVQKKARAVQEMADKVGLKGQIEVIGCRSEELAQENRERFDTAILRAVSSLPVVLELGTPLIRLGGEIIALRGIETKESVSEAEAVAQKLGLKLVSDREIKIGDEFDRRILVFEKVGESSIKLPRRNGMAQKKPLSY